MTPVIQWENTFKYKITHVPSGNFTYALNGAELDYAVQFCLHRKATLDQLKIEVLPKESF